MLHIHYRKSRLTSQQAINVGLAIDTVMQIGWKAHLAKEDRQKRECTHKPLAHVSPNTLERAGSPHPSSDFRQSWPSLPASTYYYSDPP